MTKAKARPVRAKPKRPIKRPKKVESLAEQAIRRGAWVPGFHDY